MLCTNTSAATKLWCTGHGEVVDLLLTLVVDGHDLVPAHVGAPGLGRRRRVVRGPGRDGAAPGGDQGPRPARRGGRRRRRRRTRAVADCHDQGVHRALRRPVLVPDGVLETVTTPKRRRRCCTPRTSASERETNEIRRVRAAPGGSPPAGARGTRSTARGAGGTPPAAGHRVRSSACDSRGGGARRGRRGRATGSACTAWSCRTSPTTQAAVAEHSGPAARPRRPHRLLPN